MRLLENPKPVDPDLQRLIDDACKEIRDVFNRPTQKERQP